MPRSLEEYYREQQSSWLSRAFPFSRETFRRIASDILDEHYTSAEAIVKHIAEGSGIEPSVFAQLLKDRFRGQLYREDALEFTDGYGKLTLLLQAGFILAGEGPDATQELMRQWRLSWNAEKYGFIADNIQLAAQLVLQDPTGRMMMTRFADIMTRGSKRTHFSEGVKTAHDTFMAYSKCWEEYTKGNVR
jgi:hypothetical protein